MLKHVQDVIVGKAPSGIRRSGLWPRLRKEFLEKSPRCAVCGGSKKLEVHHIYPFHVAPQFELEPDNLIVLCEAGRGGINCHLFFGHYGNYKLFNEDVRKDAASWSLKLAQART